MDSSQTSALSGTMTPTPHRAPSYLKVCQLARGGMARVDLVLRREGSFRRLYAVKRIRESFRDDPEFQKMVIDEARVAGLIRHPNVVSVLDVGADDEGPFLVMDFVDGLPLSELMHRFSGLLPLQVCLQIAKQVADALEAAHELRAHDGTPLELIHRDVSPQNILIGFDGLVRLTDFGVAKALGRQTESTQNLVKGKIGYMSPEALQFQPVDRRTDLFSLGIVLYEMLAGQRLYGGRDVAVTARKILDDPPPDIAEVRAGPPNGLVALVFDLLSKDRVHRPSRARDVSQRISRVLGEVLTQEPPLDLRAFFKEHLAHLRDEKQARIQLAIEEAEQQASIADQFEQSTAHLPSAAAKHPRIRALGVGLTAVALTAGAAWAWQLVGKATPQDPSGHLAPASTEPFDPPASKPAVTQVPASQHIAADSQHIAAEPEARPSAAEPDGAAQDPPAEVAPSETQEPPRANPAQVKRRTRPNATHRRPKPKQTTSQARRPRWDWD